MIGREQWNAIHALRAMAERFGHRPRVRPGSKGRVGLCATGQLAPLPARTACSTPIERGSSNGRRRCATRHASSTRSCAPRGVLPAATRRSTSRDKLGAYLLAHALPGVSLTISPYTEVNFSVEITIRVRPEAFDKEEVKAAVRAALIRQFSIKQRALGQVLHRGELYAVVEAVQGVENSDVVMQVPSVDG